jgi:hypothetical protein
MLHSPDFIGVSNFCLAHKIAAFSLFEPPFKTIIFSNPENLIERCIPDQLIEAQSITAFIDAYDMHKTVLRCKDAIKTHERAQTLFKREKTEKSGQTN